MIFDVMMKRTRRYFIFMFTGGAMLLVIGLLLQTGLIKSTWNARGIVGASFIPLSLAVIYFWKMRMLIKSPQKARKVFVNQTDERLARLENDTDAFSLRILRVILVFFYCGYNLLHPEEIFNSMGWWMILTLLLVSYIMKPLIYMVYTNNSNEKENDCNDDFS